MLLTSNWREWYHLRHQQSCLVSGSQFEDYVTRLLVRFHDDFVNPAPAGTLGDGGCDGLADMGRIFYACYGQRPGRNAERELQAKLNSDFARGRESWSSFHTWIFVTNAPIGPETLKTFAALQQEHSEGSVRPLSMRIWTPDDLWNKALSTFSQDVLNELFPGAPGVEDLELADLLPLLDSLGESDDGEDVVTAIRPVPPSKMDFNELPEGSRLEFNAGRLMAPRVDKWYADASNPSLYDSHGERFAEIYKAARRVAATPAEVLERIYVAVAGANFRMDAKRANAAYAVVSYFFDACHIFEMPPVGLGSAHAAAN
ncbi:ABC-three component system protein [Brevibacterium sp. FME17]|uniref:ABC-three component system protein n=1 Tax=Brevibacterium sp. FME17 TaxID=2742606 RepID=UPI001865E27F|nr:ABC-three component system protein [Brevibacterium sp. FME17]